MSRSQIPIIIDRIEDGFATLAMTVPVEVLPKNARTGDMLYSDDDGRLQVDEDETRKLRKSSFELFEGLRDKK